MVDDHMTTKTSSKCHLPLIFEARYDFRSWVHAVTGPRLGESTGRLQPITGDDVTFRMAARISVHSSSRTPVLPYCFSSGVVAQEHSSAAIAAATRIRALLTI